MSEEFECAMPLILVMALDLAVKDGKMTVEEAVEIIRRTAEKQKETQE